MSKKLSHKLIIILFPFMLVCFTGPVIAYANLIFTHTTRWIGVLSLILYLVSIGKLTVGLRGPVGILLVIMVAWTAITTIWSEQTSLTLTKSVANCLVSVGSVSGGIVWAYQVRKKNMLMFIAPIAALTVAAGLLGELNPGPARVGPELYRGLTGNPNTLAALVVMSFPLGLLYIFRSRWKKHYLALGMALIVTLGMFLLETRSRASILSIAFLVGTFIYFVKTKKGALYIWMGVLLAISLWAIDPGVGDRLYQEYVRKSSTVSEGVFYSRHSVWERSIYQAYRGGFGGGGYGVTIGDTTEVPGRFTALGYGREKGNSQLAIIEELGIIGLIIYAMFVSRIIKTFLDARRYRDAEFQGTIGLLLAVLIGLLVHSAFEAWWVAPGSFQFPFFMGSVGVAIGLIRRKEQELGGLVSTGGMLGVEGFRRRRVRLAT